MKVVLLAGGLGTRLSEETDVRPKPMVEVGGKPILWHIMQVYASQGFNEFVVALGYKGEMIKSYFRDYRILSSDLSFRGGQMQLKGDAAPDWQVDLIDTGAASMTGGRLRRLAPLLRDDGPFMVTYGDGVANVDVAALLDFHRSHGRMATLTAVRPPVARKELVIDCDKVRTQIDSVPACDDWINGGFFVFEPAILERIEGDAAVLEADVLSRLAEEGELMAYRHEGFWQCMDTLEERKRLEALCQSGDAPWMSTPRPRPVAMNGHSRRLSERVPARATAGRG